MLEAVAVSWSAAERYATSAEVIWLVVNTSWSGSCAVPARQQRVHLCRGVVGQQRSREGRVRRRDGVAVGRDAQRVGAIGQQQREELRDAGCERRCFRERTPKS